MEINQELDLRSNNDVVLGVESPRIIMQEYKIHAKTASLKVKWSQITDVIMDSKLTNQGDVDMS